MPRASILIPAFNAEETILDALQAAQSQTIEDTEIIVIDDASTDGTASLVRTRAEQDSRIILIQLSENVGPACARNAGLAVATGDWIALLDADDTMTHDRLRRLLEAAHPEDVLVADNLALYDRHAGGVVKLAINPSVIGDALQLDCAGYVSRCQTNRADAVDFGLLKPLIRASHLKIHNILYDESMRYGEDFRFYLDALIQGGNLLVLSDAYYQYTERVGSISQKQSGLSKTIARYDRIEGQARQLAADPRYSRVAAQLTQRADAIRKLSKVIAFRDLFKNGQKTQVFIALKDAEIRSHLRQKVGEKCIALRPSNWTRNTLIRDSSNLCLGQAIKLILQGIYFLCIARSLGPAQYGAFVAVTAMTSIVTPYVGLGCGNLFLKNVRAGKREADICWGNGLLVTFLTGGMLTAVLCALAFLWSPGVSMPLIASICFSDLILTRIIDLASFGFAASGKMSKTAVQNTTMSILRVAGILLLIAFYREVTAAQWGWVYLATAVVGGVFALQQGIRLWGMPKLSLAAIVEDAREGSFFSISTSAQTIYNDIDKTMLAKLSTLSATGVYAAAYRMIDTSLTPVRSLVSAAYPEFFRIGADGLPATRKYAWQLIQKSIIFGIVDFIALIAIAPLLPHILGAKYSNVAPAIQLLALIPLMRCIHWFLADALSGANLQGVRTAIQVAVALLNIGLNLLILPRWSWVGAAWTSLASDAVLMCAVYLAVQGKGSIAAIPEAVPATE